MVFPSKTRQRRDRVGGGKDFGPQRRRGKCGERVVELRDGSSADDGGRDGRSAQDPLQREVVQRHARLGREVAERTELRLLREDLIRLQKRAVAGGAGVGRDPGEVFRSEHALGERAENRRADFTNVLPLLSDK